MRDVWERERRLVMRGKATDFQNRFAEDVELAKELGCTAFRFSLAWSRIEPAPGQFDHVTFDYYRRLISAICTAGMEPILTLHHFTWPMHVQQRCGMISDEFPLIYARYVTEVVKRLGQDVRYWITFNEPSQLIYGYVKPWWEPNYFAPPGLPEDATLNDQILALGQLIRNLFIAHTEARKIIKASNSNAMVGANPLLLGLPVWLQRLINWNATRIKSKADLNKQVQRLAAPRYRTLGEERNLLMRLLRQLFDPIVRPYSILSTVVASNWWHLGMAGKLPGFLCPRECVGQQDFVGLDYYWGISRLRLDRIGRLMDAAMGRFGRAPVWPGALYDHLKYQASLFPDLPLLIIENGSVDVADSIDRATYIRKHISQVQRAVKDGVNVIGYTCWCITSNREWGLPFDKNSDFGLYHIELDQDPDLRRVPTPAAWAYKEIIAERGG
jgi:beta-glucosidase/6-phospho-beta-glucosidase/beta-galactosidase